MRSTESPSREAAFVSACDAREGVEIVVSTLADRVGASVATLDPIVHLIRTHVFGAGRIHAGDSVLQKHMEGMVNMI